MNLDRTILSILLLLAGAGIAVLSLISRRLPLDSSAVSTQQSTRLKRVFDVVLVAVWFGLATGAVHVSLILINHYARHRFVMVSPHAIWMIPVANAMIFAGFGLLLGLLTACHARIPVRTSVSVFASLGLFSLLQPFPQLHKLAALALAIGLAVHLGRHMAARLDSWLPLMRRGVIKAAAVLLAIGSVQAGWYALAERYDVSRLTKAQPGAPNVLLIVMDTVRARSLSLYGYNRPTTPNLERWARQGVVFDMALSTAPWTLKAHGTMFSGLYAREFPGNFEEPVSIGGPVLAEVMRDRGYLTGGFVANLLYTSRESGLERGFVHYDDYRVSLRQVLLHSWIPHARFFVDLAHCRSLRDVWRVVTHPTLELDARDFNHRTYERRPAGQINDAFLEWQAANSGRPFFAFLNYFDAHPYEAPREFQRKFALAGKINQGLYDGAVAYIDSEINRLLTELQERNVLDNTIVVITSDHGEQFGEHGLTFHANSLYLPLLHVPLIIRYPPAIPAGRRTETAVTLRDLAKTIADLAELPDATFPGASLSSQWSDGPQASSPSPVRASLLQPIRPQPGSPATYGPMRTLFDARYHYIRRGDGAEQIFDYRNDPDEVHDLAGTEAGRRKLEELRMQLIALTGPLLGSGQQ